MLTGRHVPHMGRGVGRRGHQGSVRTKGHARKPSLVSLEHMYLITRAGIPEPHGVILGSAGEERAIRRIGDFVDAVVVALEFMDGRQGRAVPDHNAAVIAAGRERGT